MPFGPMRKTKENKDYLLQLTTKELVFFCFQVFSFVFLILSAFAPSVLRNDKALAHTISI